MISNAFFGNDINNNIDKIVYLCMNKQFYVDKNNLSLLQKIIGELENEYNKVQKQKIIVVTSFNKRLLDICFTIKMSIYKYVFTNRASIKKDLNTIDDSLVNFLKYNILGNNNFYENSDNTKFTFNTLFNTMKYLNYLSCLIYLFILLNYLNNLTQQKVKTDKFINKISKIIINKH